MYIEVSLLVFFEASFLDKKTIFFCFFWSILYGLYSCYFLIDIPSFLAANYILFDVRDGMFKI